MKLRTHFAFTLFILSLLWPFLNDAAIFTGIALIATVLPDLDNSALKFLGHREVMHSITFSVLTGALLAPFTGVYYAVAFVSGYCLHLLADVMTITGVPLIWPYPKRAKLALFATGSFKEDIVFFVISAALVLNLLKYIF